MQVSQEHVQFLRLASVWRNVLTTVIVVEI